MHWNIQINIQSVEESHPIESASRHIRPGNSLPPMTERKINKVLELAIVAESEEEAYAKAHRMLDANAPQPN